MLLKHTDTSRKKFQREFKSMIHHVGCSLLNDFSATEGSFVFSFQSCLYGFALLPYWLLQLEVTAWQHSLIWDQEAAFTVDLYGRFPEVGLTTGCLLLTSRGMQRDGRLSSGLHLVHFAKKRYGIPAGFAFQSPSSRHAFKNIHFQ